MTVNIKSHVVNLQGKEYTQVSGRVLLAHDDNPDTLTITSEIVSMDADAVVMRATVVTRKGTFTGYAQTVISKLKGPAASAPLEVTETSAVGRALGFAGYAIEGGIASADEMDKASEGAVGPQIHSNGNGAEVARLRNGIKYHLQNVLELDAPLQKQLVATLSPDKRVADMDPIELDTFWAELAHIRSGSQARALISGDPWPPE